MAVRKYATIEVRVVESGNGSIHLVSDDPRLTDENGVFRGMNIRVSVKHQPKTDRWLRLLIHRYGDSEYPKPGPCPCECNHGGFCGGCGHAGCGGRVVVTSQKVMEDLWSVKPSTRAFIRP